MAIEIVSFPSKKTIFNGYVSLSEGNLNSSDPRVALDHPWCDPPDQCRGCCNAIFALLSSHLVTLGCVSPHSQRYNITEKLPSGNLKLWKMVIYSGFFHWTLWFSIAILNHQRVTCWGSLFWPIPMANSIGVPNFNTDRWTYWELPSGSSGFINHGWPENPWTEWRCFHRPFSSKPCLITGGDPIDIYIYIYVYMYMYIYIYIYVPYPCGLIGVPNFDTHGKFLRSR